MTTTDTALSTISAVKVSSSIIAKVTYHQITYKQAGSWHQYYRLFKDPKDARRVAKSILDSQGFNLSTTGGMP